MYTVSALHKHALAFEIKKPDLKKSITNYLKYAIHTFNQILCLYVLDYKILKPSCAFFGQTSYIWKMIVTE